MPSGNGENRRYNRVTEEIANRLTSILGSDRVIWNDAKTLQRYGYDQVADRSYGHPPEIVVQPQSAEEIRDILLFAGKESIPVTPRGAGSGLSGGAVPMLGGISLSLELMNRIIEIDRGNMVAVVEPGVITNQLDARLSEEGLFFAGYPLSEEFCQIGGNVAENAGGGRAVKYGVTSRYVTGIEAVLPTGEIVSVGGKRYKDVTGYDLLHLLIGSEGTLAVFSRIILRVLPRPGARAMMRIVLTDEAEALDMVPELLADPVIQPSAIEFIDKVSLAETIKLQRISSFDENDTLLFVEIDGSDDSSFEKRLSRISSAGTRRDAVAFAQKDKRELRSGGNTQSRENPRI